MHMSIEIPEEKIETLIKNVMQNYPEASTPSLICINCNHDECKYTFLDEEEGEEFDVDYAKLRKGFEKFIALGLSKKFNAPGWDCSLLLRPNIDWDDWERNWDAEVIDGLVQCAIFGEVIFG